MTALDDHHSHLANSTSSTSTWTTKFSGGGGGIYNNRSSDERIMSSSSLSLNKTLSPVTAAFEQFVNSSAETLRRGVNGGGGNVGSGNYFNSEIIDDPDLEDLDDFRNGSGSIVGESGSEFFNFSIAGNGSGGGGGGGESSTSIRGNLYASIVPVMLFFCVLAVLVNLLIVISARWCRKPMSPTLYFSISLALADAYAAFILATGLVINSLLPYVFSFYGVPICLSLVVEAFR